MLAIVANDDIQIFLRVIHNTNTRTLLFVKSLSHMLTNILCQKYESFLKERLESSTTAVQDLAVSNLNKCHTKTRDWFSKRHIHNNNDRDSQAVFNALDTVLKDNLDRLTKLRNVEIDRVLEYWDKINQNATLVGASPTVRSQQREKILIGGIDLRKCKSDTSFTKDADLVRGLCVKGKVGAALLIRNKMLVKCIALDVLTQNHLINGLCKTGNLDKASRIIKEMLEVGPFPDHFTYTILIGAYCRLDNVDAARSLYSSMRENGIKPDRVTLNILLHTLCKNGHIRYAKKLVLQVLGEVAGTSFWNYSSTSYFTANAAIVSILCGEQNVDAALSFWNIMREKGVKFDVFAHNYLINGLCRIGDLDKAMKIVDEMCEVGPSPNNATYNILITEYFRLQDRKRACGLVDWMTQTGLLNTVTYRIVMQAECKFGNIERAKKLMLNVSDGSGAPDLFCSTALFDVYFRNGEIDRALEIWNEMCYKGTKLDVRAYNALIYGFCSNTNMIMAYRYFCEMCKKGFKPDLCTYNTLICGLCKEGRIDEACNLHNAMSNMGVIPDEDSYQRVIQYLCDVGDITRATTFLLGSSDGPTTADPFFWNKIMHGYLKKGKFQDLKNIQRQMVKVGVVPNTRTYNLLILLEVMCGNIDEALSLKEAMHTKGLLPDIFTYNTLVGAFCNSGDLKHAIQLQKEMSDRGYEPDVHTYTRLIQGYCIEGNIMSARKILDNNILRSSFTLTHVPFQILILKYCEVGDPLAAFDVYKEMKKRGIRSLRKYVYYRLITDLGRKKFRSEADQMVEEYNDVLLVRD